jgi:predicted Zn-dependent peptidase
VAQDATAFQGSSALASTFMVIVTARAGHGLEEIRRLVDEEIARLAAEPPSERELTRFQNRTEAGFYDRLERVSGFGGKADQLNAYYFSTGNPDSFEEDLARYRALDPSDVQAAVSRWLGPGRVRTRSISSAGSATWRCPQPPAGRGCSAWTSTARPSARRARTPHAWDAKQSSCAATPPRLRRNSSARGGASR